MDRMPLAYVLIVVFLALACLAVFVGTFYYFRNRPHPSAKEKLAGYMLAGPFFGLLHSSLKSRGYKLTPREKIGLAFIACVIIFLVVAAIVSTYART